MLHGIRCRFIGNSLFLDINKSFYSHHSLLDMNNSFLDIQNQLKIEYSSIFFDIQNWIMDTHNTNLFLYA